MNASVYVQMHVYACTFLRVYECIHAWMYVRSCVRVAGQRQPQPSCQTPCVDAQM